jgi:hypothetical protein
MGAPGASERTARAGGSQLTVPAIVLLVVLSGVWAWWGWKQGAYFAVVLLPGTILLCLVALLYASITPRPAGVRLSLPAAIAIGALVALGCWEVLSATWSPAPDAAVFDGQRVLVYALSFGLGVWLCLLLGERPNLSLVPLAVAAGVTGLVAILGLLTNDVPNDVLELGTLEYPLGYRNAEAAFFAIAVFPAVGLAADGGRAVWLRAVALGIATMSIELCMLAQSRASVPAMIAALIVYALAAPKRVPALSWLLLAAIPAVAILPALTSLYDAGQHGALDALDEMRTAGTAVAVIAVVAGLIGAAAARFEARLPGFGSDSPRSNRAVAVGMAVLALASVVAFVVAVGDPGAWISKRADEFRYGGTPDLSGSSSRFGFSVGSDRYDLWRVALDDAGDDPLLGDGGGGYQYSYLVQRAHARQQVHDAHSVELETLAEFGVPGLVMLLTAFVAAGAGLIWVRWRAPAAAGLAAIALPAATYWLVHTSVDWFWPYPVVTAPLLGLVGAACAHGPPIATRRGRVPWLTVLAVGAGVLALSAIAPFLSQRYVDQAYSEWRTDRAGAYDDLERAQDLNRLSITPLLAEGAIATASGEGDHAIAAFEAAADKRPEEWAAHFLLARLQLRSDPQEARRELQLALELNPREERVRELARRLGVTAPES